MNTDQLQKLKEVMNKIILIVTSKLSDAEKIKKLYELLDEEWTKEGDLL